MKWFNNLTIKFKLIFTFGIVSLFIAIVGGLGMLNINKISYNSNILYEERFQAIKNLQEFNSNALHMRIEVLNIVSSGNINKLSEIKSKVDDFNKKNDEIIKVYDKTNLNDNEKEIYKNIKTDSEEYKNTSNKIISLVADKKYDEAVILSNEISTIREKLTNNIDKLVQMTETEAEAINVSNSNIRDKFLKYMLLDIGLGIFISILLGISVALFISKSLKKVVEYAKFL